MTERKTSLSEGIGSRCEVCVGCGRCVSGKRMHMITENRLAAQFPPLQLPPGEMRRLICVDIGTTTVAMQLYDPGGRVLHEFARVNPQTLYGADVLSRIQTCEQGFHLRIMQSQIREVLKEGLEEMKAFLKPGEQPVLVVAGNTTMNYLFMGWDPRELGQAPFNAGHLEETRTLIGEIPCVVLPGFSAFVGGDILAGVLACRMEQQKELTLLVDLGTNGEMVLGNRDRMLACATAAGPAFEGGVNKGVWGADMVQLIARLRQRQLVDETGLLAEPYFEKGIRIGDVTVTERSIRAIQLAKAAIAAGIRILMKEYGIEGQWSAIGKVVLAGGFGYYLDPKDAVQIGLLPEAFLEKTIAGGNTALAGAYRYGAELLLQDRAQDGIGELKNTVSVLNLAQHPDFDRIYIDYLNLEGPKGDTDEKDR